MSKQVIPRPDHGLPKYPGATFAVKWIHWYGDPR